ncbi:UDP-2,3-diacylglucosamine diphosphatase [Pedobacter sp. MR2016-24]|uniref:UDP-2,3-diacylglucosamine diphosphatase n=1 Tax=Pedobacter sp. MR2016-24 TaxID=2994466 RepID=UPI002246000F|nr:UDP-2,3-diacylglucosamine diphosphatase [Pedobacter sp. MR2016-24]MCX2485115.1 UDP-2,3-diacylglucosamine diphosphatase [Pedobacter sp. MR2016-24]
MTKNIYFASDFHLGSPNHAESRIREDRIVRWLTSIEDKCSELFLMGDIFDFWFEYRKVVPKGYIRLQGKLANMSDAGVKIYFFKGNHDMWVEDYFTKEMGIQIVSDELVINRGGKSFYLHHGDGLGPGDANYRILRKVFRNPVCRWLFSILPPVIGLGIATGWSKESRIVNTRVEEVFLGEDKEWLAVYSREVLEKQHYDYFIYGHRHLPMIIELGNNSQYYNIGEWFGFNSYAVFDGEELRLEYFEKEAS